MDKAVPGKRHCGVFSCDYQPSSKSHIDYIQQSDEIENSWSRFILDLSNGFPRAGIERLNDSIRTYCWAILNSQTQTMTSIIGTGTAFDAQKEFLTLVEVEIDSFIDLPHQISRYQSILKNARSKVDFVYGESLYMSPSDMEIRIGKIQNYNNEIVVATSNQSLGLNNNINTTPIPPKQISILQGTKTKQVQPVYNSSPSHSDTPVVKPVYNSSPSHSDTQHEDNKSTIIVGSIIVGLITIFIYNIY